MTESNEVPVGVDASVLLAAYQATQKEMSTLRVREICWVDNGELDAARRILEHVPKIQSLRPRLLRLVASGYRIDWVDHLERYAHAAMHAAAVYRDKPEPEGSLVQLVKRAAELRALLTADCMPLLSRKILAQGALADFDGGVSAQDIACDLLVLRGVLAGIYPEIRGRCAFTPADLVEAEVIAHSVLRRLVDPSEEQPWLWEPFDSHLRAFTVLYRAYDEARRGVVYLRWHDEDDHEYAPEVRGCPEFFRAWLPAQRGAARSEQDTRRRARVLTTALTTALTSGAHGRQPAN